MRQPGSCVVLPFLELAEKAGGIEEMPRTRPILSRHFGHWEAPEDGS